MEKRKSSEPDKHWMEWLVSMIRNQGTWGTSYVRYRLDKIRKIAYVIAKNTARPARLTESNCQRTAEAFATIGWRVVDNGLHLDVLKRPRFV
jgi:hypothetical protein